MAKYERMVNGNFQRIVSSLDDAIMNGSATATLEETTSFSIGDFRSTVRVYERYSYFGGDRVSLTLSIAGSGNTYKVSAITTGGSQAMFFKLNTWGEESFLETITGAIDSL